MLKKVSYPAARRSASSYVMHENTIVPDPYDWLESPDAEETKSFVTAQNKVFEESISPFDKKDLLKTKLTDLRQYQRFGCPNRGKNENEFYYYHNPGLLNQSRLMRLRQGLNQNTEDAEVFLDPNTLAKDGTSSIGTSGWSISRRYFAHGISEKGSDWNTVHVKDAETNEMLPDVVSWVKYSGISWYQDPSTKKDIGFFYTRFPNLSEGVDKGTETNKADNSCVYFHRLGESQDKDVPILRDSKHPDWLCAAGPTDDMKYLMGTFSDGCEKENLLWIAPIPTEIFADKTPGETEWKWIKVSEDWSAEWDCIANEGNKFWFKTNLKAPGYKVVTFTLDETAGNDGKKNILSTDNTTVVVPESKYTLEGAYVVFNYVLLLYLEDVKHVLYIAKLDTPTDSKKFDMPIASLAGLACRRFSPFVAIKLSSFVLPGRSYFFELKEDGSSPLPPPLTVWRDEGPQGFNGDDFVVEQYFYKSPAGERKVPMFVCRRKDITYNGDRPVIQYQYGGFSISVSPSFSVGSYVWMKYFGGVYCVANIRGGGELPGWHDEGKAMTKMNCYLDMKSAAEFIQNDLKITCPKKTAIMGGSNGGTAVGAAVNLAPHLFGAVVCQVGVMDLFKFHKYGIGHAWKSDFNDPDKEEDFRYIQKFSPLHNIRGQVHYPPIAIFTGDHDDRVSPLHSHKYAAVLQSISPDFGGPFLERVEVNAGHGAGKSLEKVIGEQVDTYSFLSLALNAPMQE